MRLGLLLAALSLVGCIDAGDPVGSSSLATGVVTDCWIEGNGAIDPDGSGARDLFAGVVHHTGATADSAEGTWAHGTSMGDRLAGTPDVMECRANGGYSPGGPAGSTAQLSDFSGTATWNGAPGYTFRVHGEDRGGAPDGDLHNDYYSITVFGPDGAFVYFAGGTTEAGNYEIY